MRYHFRLSFPCWLRCSPCLVGVAVLIFWRHFPFHLLFGGSFFLVVRCLLLSCWLCGCYWFAVSLAFFLCWLLSFRRWPGALNPLLAWCFLFPRWPGDFYSFGVSFPCWFGAITPLFVLDSYCLARLVLLFHVCGSYSFAGLVTLILLLASCLSYLCCGMLRCISL